MSATIVQSLLREPNDIIARCEVRQGLKELAIVSLACVALGAAVFGGAVGSFRGGMQVAYSAVKLPFALLATLVVCVPAFHALTIGFGGRSRFSAVAALTLSASARAALVLFACAPVLWLAVDSGLAYHSSVLLATVMYLASGLAALGIIVKGLGGSLRAWITAAACSLVFFGVLGQTAWMLRPFFGRPSQSAIPFVRAREGAFADAVVRTSRSARGVYDATRSTSRESASASGDDTTNRSAGAR